MSTKPIEFHTIHEALDYVKSYDYPILKYVDNGIGQYEYWGFKGVDHQREWEMQDSPDTLRILLALPKDGNFEDDILAVMDVLEEAIHEKQGEYISHLEKETEGKFDGTIRLEYSFSILFLTNSTVPSHISITADWLEG